MLSALLACVSADRPALRVGERVNLECDMLGKYVVRFAELAGWATAGPAAPR